MSALVRSSLVSRSPKTKSLTTHRLVQATIFERLPKDQVSFYLDATITILSKGFPNTWKDSGPRQGHGFASWESCSEVLPHVNWLIDLTKKHKLKPSNPENFAELVFRAGT